MLVGQFMLAQIPSYVPTNGLVGFWPFSGNANDQSINANNGSVTGATLTTDRFGSNNSAYNFNGTSNFIMVPNNTSLSGFNDMSISMWVNMSQYGGYQALTYKWAYTLACGGNTDNYATSMSSNQIMMSANYNNTTGYISPTLFTAGDLNTWKHFVFVSNSAQGISIYINGVLAGTGTVAGTICNSTNPLYFGASNGTSRFFKGKLDDIGIWNRVLTYCEIQDLYNAGGNISTSNNTMCSSGSVTLTAGAGGTNYLWSTGATTSVIVVSPTVTTNYTVTTTNTITGCANTSTITQNVSSILSLTTSSSNSLICAGNPATLTVNGNATNYFWTTSATSSVIVVNPTVTTTYTVFGINAVSGCTATSAVTQNVSSVTLTPTSSNNTICPGNSATLTVTGNATNYLWNTSSTNTTIAVSPTTATTYTVSGTNTITGCSNMVTFTQNVSALPNVNAASSNSTICAGNSATLTASGATNYLWSNSIGNASIVVSPTVTTTYSVTGTNTATGCSATTTITQNVSNVNLLALSSNSLICTGSSATLTVNGNATTYFWNTSSTNTMIVVSPTITTTYTVFGTNAVSGCTATAYVTQNVSTCTALNDLKLEKNILIYPNPVNNDLNVNFSASEKNDFIVLINDIAGKQLMKQAFYEEENIHINMDLMDNGIYFLNILNTDGKLLKVEKIVVSK